MDQENEFTDVIEALQAFQLTDGFMNSEWIMECYDASFSLGAIEEGLVKELGNCSIDALQNVVEKMLVLLEKLNTENVAAHQNILSLLDHAKVPIREMIAAVAAFLHLGVKAKTGGVAVRGALGGAFYALILAATKGQIPAALHSNLGIKLYNLSLFTKSVDMLCIATPWKSSTLPVKKGRGRQAVQVDQEYVEGNQAEVTMEYNLVWPEAQLLLLKAWAVFLRSIDLDAVPFHMGRLARALATVWAREFPHEELVVNPPPPFSSRRLVTSRCFSLLVADTVKRDLRETNVRMVLFGLMPGMLRLADDLSSYKPTIPRPVDAYGTKVVQFVTELMVPFIGDELYDQTFFGFMQGLFTNVPDSQSYRRTCASMFMRFLDYFNLNLRIEIVEWVVIESEGERTRSRKLALEVISALFYKDWPNFDIPYAHTASVEAIVWKVCCDRLKDRSAQVRKIAACVLQDLPLEKNNVKWMERLQATRQDDGSFRKVFQTILDGCSEMFATPRKTCIHLLGRLLKADAENRLFDDRVREVILRAAQDPAKLVRQANMDLVSSLSNVDQPVFVDLWIKCVFNLHMDAESTIRQTATESFQTVVLDEVTQPIQIGNTNRTMAWGILSRICRDEIGSLRLLRQLLAEMKKNNLIDRNTVKCIKANVFLKDGIDKSIGETAWKFLAELSRLVKDDRNVDFALDFLKNAVSESGEDVCCASALQIVQFNLNNSSKENDVHRYGPILLEMFPRIVGVAAVVEAVRAIHTYFELVKDGDTAAFTVWATGQLVESSRRLDETLNHLTNSNEPEMDSKATFDVRLIGEISLHSGLYQKGHGAVARVGNTDPLQLIVKMCDFDNAHKYRPWIRAHAIFALGRLCLGSKRIAWDYIKNVVDVANASNLDNGLRRDAIIVVFDVLRMFGDVVESHLGKVYGWLSDPCIEIRGDVINHIQTLLLNEHLQWNPTVFYQFLTSICDPDETIRDSVRTCLRSLIKKRNQCYTDFAEAVVFLPRCVTHPRFKAAQTADRHNAKFPLVGRENAPKRLEIYTFMLKQMNDEQKRMTMHRILEQILIPVVTKEVDIARRTNGAFKDVLLDVMRIMGLKEMEFSAFVEEEDDGEGDEENENEDQNDAAQRNGKKMSKDELKQIWNKFRKELIQRHLIPVLAAVYRQLREPRDDNELFQACVSLVDNMARVSEIDLEELARQTGGTEGLVYKALVIDINLQRGNDAVISESDRAGAVSVEQDGIPLVRESPLLSKESPSVTDGSTHPEKVSRVGEDSTLTPKSETQREASEAVRSDGESGDTQITSRAKRDVTKRSGTVLAAPSGSKREHSIIADEVPPKRKPGSVTQRATRNKTKNKPNVEDDDAGSEKSADPDETLKAVQSISSRSSQNKAAAKNAELRAISTPIANRTRRALNVTFGSDISAIVTDQTMVQKGARK